MKLNHDDGDNDVNDSDVGGDANHDVGYDVIDEADNHVDDDVGNDVGGCHPWHDHPFFIVFFFSQKGFGEAPFMF